MAVGSGAIRAGKAFVEIFADTNPLERNLKSAGASLAGFGKKIGALGLGIAGAFAPMVKAAADVQTAEVAFSTLLGSMEKAEQVMGDLRKFAAETPFELPELTDASRQLLAFGVAQEDLIGTLRQVGDVSAAVGAPIGEIAELYGKAKVQGRLFMEDINQLTGRGIPIIGELAKQFGVAESEVRKLVENGSVNFGHLQTAFGSLSGEGGKFAGMMAAQSQTIAGKWSSLKDELREVGVTIGTELLPLLTDLATAASVYVQEAGKWVKDNRALASTIAKVGAAVGGAGLALYGIGKAAMVAADGIKTMREITALLGGNLKTLGAVGAAAGIAALAYAVYEANSDIRALNKNWRRLSSCRKNWRSSKARSKARCWISRARSTIRRSERRFSKRN